MKSRINKAVLYIKRHKIFSSVVFIVVVALIIAGVFLRNGKEIAVQEVTAKEFNKETSIAGKVIATQEADLSFETSGNIAAVYKDVNNRVEAGEVIAALSSADIQADLLKAQADLDAEVAKLNEVKSGTGDDTETLNAKRSLVEELSKAYIQADDAIQNKVDQFFEDPLENDPKIVFAFNDFWLKQQIDKERIEIEELLIDWQKQRNSVTVNSVSTEVEKVKTRLREIQSFLENVSTAINVFEVNDTLSQNQIDKYKADVATARTNINSSISSIISAQEKVRSTEAQIPFQEAKVKSARAVVANYSAQLAKTIIRAPFRGVVSKQDAKIGQYASSNMPLVTVISDGSFQIETFIPEININEIKVGNVAKVTLDAFSDAEVFDAKVISIDPAETVRDGVSTYKVIFEFINGDDRLKTGMTTNVDITTQKRDNVITLPQSAVIKKNGASFVQVKVGKEIVEKQITTGDVASTGEIEVVSGLTIGEKVVVEPQPIN